MNPLLYKLSIRNGLIIGGIYAFLIVVFYLINPILQYTNFWVGGLIALTMVVLIVILALDARRQMGGFWNFGKAYLSLMIVTFIITLISVLAGFLILKLNPGLIQKINDASLDLTEKMLEKFGSDQTKTDAATQQFTNGQFMDTIKPTFSNEMLNFIKVLLFYWVVDLIIAACIKKNPPMFTMEGDSEVIQ